MFSVETPIKVSVSDSALWQFSTSTLKASSQHLQNNSYNLSQAVVCGFGINTDAFYLELLNMGFC